MKHFTDTDWLQFFKSFSQLSKAEDTIDWARVIGNNGGSRAAMVDSFIQIHVYNIKESSSGSADSLSFSLYHLLFLYMIQVS